MGERDGQVLAIATCPQCGERGKVEIARHPAGDFFCGGCSLIFAGSRQEWEHGYTGSSPLRDWRRAGGRRPGVAM